MWDKTPLHEAANEGHDELVWFLVENGARIEATSNKKRFTPLHLASQFGHVSVVEYLVQNGADVSAQAEVRLAITRLGRFYFTSPVLRAFRKSRILRIHLYRFIFLFIHLLVCLFMCCLMIYIFIYLFVYLLIYLFILFIVLGW